MALKIPMMKTLAEAIRSFVKPFTVRYPFEPSPAPEGFRGLPEVDADKCTVCGVCAAVCPARAITVEDDGSSRKIEFWHASCIFCGQCAAFCYPLSAVKMTERYSVVVTDKEELKVLVEDASVASELVNAMRCISCGWCEAVCAFNAIKLTKSDGIKWTPSIDVTLCKGCGTCAATCPAYALDMRLHSKDAVLERVRAAVEELKGVERRPRVLVFSCTWCGAEEAGIAEKYENVRLVKLMCTGGLDNNYILEALKGGVDGVLVLGCEHGECHFVSGNFWAEFRFKELKAMLEGIGLGERFDWVWVSAEKQDKIFAAVENMISKLK
ncbi:MAG: Heterodisulfide reductase [Candidatus Alkanophagales archaeon MCA70_species_2]|nr:Heterodisulfide reductase [Candidatus Alkanophaga liquidiphilum]